MSIFPRHRRMALAVGVLTVITGPAATALAQASPTALLERPPVYSGVNGTLHLRVNARW